MADYQAQLDTVESQLEEISTAITSLLADREQSFSVGGRSVSYADLGALTMERERLTKERTRLERLAARQSRGGMRIQQIVPRG